MNAKHRQWALGFLALLFAAGLWLQHLEKEKLLFRLDEAEKRAQSAEAAQETAANIAKSNAEEARQLQQTILELPRLRGEVAELRRDLAEKNASLKQNASTAAAASRNAAAKLGVVAFGDELRDVGAATPEHAATSLIWAAMSGEKNRLSDLLELPATVSDADAPRHFEYFGNMLSNKFAELEFTGITSIKPNPDGTLRLGIEYREPETGKTNPFPFMLRQHDGQWKVVVEGNLPPNF